MKRWLWLLLFTLSGPLAAEVADVRIAIDISGSMQRTDPHNLRQPALELLAQLMPEQSHAGVWLFGQQVNMLVPHRPVTGSWRQQAFERAAQISSVALYTHIGAVLEAVSYDRTRLDPTRRTSIILLTDGMVDISPDATVNARERERILSELLPQLQSAGYRIHTIALSEEADLPLMEALSRSTGGVSAVAHTADELMGIFLRIFDRAVPQDRLPITDNGFLVDASVKEFSALIFRPAEAHTRLQTPAGQTLSAAQHPAGVRWYRADFYDLITVQQPAPGRWQLLAPAAPDSRITVVSDLRLHMSELPDSLPVNQAITLEYRMLEAGEPLADQDFLALLEHQLVLESGAGTAPPRTLNAQPEGGVGQFRVRTAGIAEPGDYQLRLVVDGKTFRREFVQPVQVQPRLAITMERLLHTTHVEYRLRVSAAPDINPERSSVVAHIQNSEGLSLVRSFEYQPEGYWQLSYSPEQPGRYSLQLRASGQVLDGGNFHETLPNQYFTFPQEGDPYIDPEEARLRALIAEYQAQLAADAEPEQPVDSAQDGLPDPEAPVAESTGEPEKSSSWWLYALIGVLNLALLAGAFFGYRRLMRADSNTEETLTDPALDGSDSVPEERLSMQQIPEEPPPVTEPPVVSGQSTPVKPVEPAGLDAVDIDEHALEDLFPLNESDATDVDADQDDDDTRKQ